MWRGWEECRERRNVERWGGTWGGGVTHIQVQSLFIAFIYCSLIDYVNNYNLVRVHFYKTSIAFFSQRCAHLIHCHISFHSSSSETALITGSGLVGLVVCYLYAIIISLGVQVKIGTLKWSCWCFVTTG